MLHNLSPLIEIVCSDQKQFPSDTLPRILLLNKVLIEKTDSTTQRSTNFIGRNGHRY